MVLRTLERTLSVDVATVLRLANVISWCAGHQFPFHKSNNEGTLKNPKLEKACCIHVPRWWCEQKRLYTCFYIEFTEFHGPYIYLVQFSEMSQAGARTCHVVGFTRGRYREHSTTRIEPDKTARWPRMSERAPATGRPQRYPHVLAVRLWQMGLGARAWARRTDFCPHVSSCFITMWSHSTDKAKSLTLISLYHQTFNQLKRLTAQH